MPLSISKPADEQVLVCCVSHHSDLGTSVAGEELRASDPRTKVCPEWWVPADTPMSERPTEFDRVNGERHQSHMDAEAQRRGDFERAAKANPAKLSVIVYEANADFPAFYAGQPTLVKKGSVVAGADHELVQGHPDKWEAKKR